MNYSAFVSVILLAFSSSCEGFGISSNKSVQTNKVLQQQNNEAVSNKVVKVDYEKMTKVITGSIFGLGMALSTTASPSMAVSGGGLDFAGLDISGQDFSNNSKAYKGKDFTQVLAKATNFAGSNFQGCRFFKAYLVNADFSNADIRGAALEGSNLEGANLKNTIAAGAYFGETLVDVKSAENADFTDATIPPKTLALFCERSDVKGTNPVTGEDTRDSLMCP